MVPIPPPGIGASTAEFVNAAWSYAIYILLPMLSPFLAMVVGLGLGLGLLLHLVRLYRRYFLSSPGSVVHGSNSDHAFEDNDED